MQQGGGKRSAKSVYSEICVYQLWPWLFMCLGQSGGALLPVLATGYERLPSADGQHQPKLAELLAVPQSLLFQCIWRPRPQ